MENYDDMLDQLKNSSGEMKSNLHMLNEIVPVEEQMKYFQYSKYIQAEKDKPNLDRNYLIARLFTPEVNIEDKKYYLSVLAGLVDVAAYRAIETYHKSPMEPELTNWSAMALVESKILLDSELSGEKQFFVSTGLGGRDGRLRHFSIVASANREMFTDFQRETLLRELQFSFEHDNIVVESIETKGNYIKMFILCDLNHNAAESLENAIKEANEFGNFVDTKFLMTNVKVLDDEEIMKLLKRTDEAEKSKTKNEESTD